MRRTCALVLIIALCLCPVLSMAEAIATPPSSESLMLPLGIWLLTEDGSWSLNTQTDATLSPAQAELAEEADIRLVDGKLPAGSVLTLEQLFLLYPGAEEHFNPPTRKPELELFAMDGEWYYDDDGVLYYNHGDGYDVMTVDEVFAALGGKPTTAASEKIIYLTIDDAPSIYTMDLLATLDRLSVKATFFVVGAYVRQRPTFLRAIYEQGHVVANHSFSHDAGNLSSTFNNCLNDFQRCEEAVHEALGFELAMPILRVPYGSTTLPTEFRTKLQKLGYMWIDWNALNGDTEPDIKSDADALQRAISTASRYDGSIVMLVHDGKKRTIRTLEEMVKHFHAQGYEFRVLDTNIEKIPGVRTGYPS